MIVDFWKFFPMGHVPQYVFVIGFTRHNAFTQSCRFAPGTSSVGLVSWNKRDILELRLTERKIVLVLLLVP